MPHSARSIKASPASPQHSYAGPTPKEEVLWVRFTYKRVLFLPHEKLSSSVSSSGRAVILSVLEGDARRLQGLADPPAVLFLSAWLLFFSSLCYQLLAYSLESGQLPQN